MPNRTNRPLIVLGLGSNLGDSRSIIINAIKVLEKFIVDLRRASFYETDPLYVTDQGRFINTAVSGFFDGSPQELLKRINKVEELFGRDRSIERRWGERFLDIDILLFGDQIIKHADLEIPHPRLKERRFALEPLLELLPDAAEPGTGLLYSCILQTLPNQGEVTLLPEG
jgi:2-amino-4-hydroxy-6-hydroxymethyldihydropteridine diphosphokinase